MQIGIVVPLAEDEKRGRALTFEEIRDNALQAEALDIDSIWIYDHLLHRFPSSPPVGFWECWTILSALAAVTRRVSIGTQVICTAFRNPALLAKMAATLDEVSKGRFILGIGAGWHKPEFDAFGISYDHLATRFEEAIQIISALLREGHADFQGSYYSANNCELRPRGPSPAGPPILVAAFGPRMLHITARYGDGWNTDWLGSEEIFVERHQALTAACLDVARDPATLQITGGLTVAYPELGDLPSWMTGPDQYITGPPEEVAAALQLYERLGVSHVMCSYYPNKPECLTRFAEAVAAYKQSKV